MEENESISTFMSQIKELRDKLGDIGEKVANTILVTITMNGLNDDYQMFILDLNVRDKSPNFLRIDRDLDARGREADGS